MHIESIPHWFVSSKTIEDLDNNSDIFVAVLAINNARHLRKR